MLSFPFTVNQVFVDTLQQIYEQPNGPSPRGMLTKELLAKTTIIPMCQPVLTIAERKLGYKFMAAEAAWIMSGDNRVATIAPYSKEISRFSDNGVFYFGSYGPKVIDQISYVVQKLAEDQDTRQAFMTIWREQPRITKDVPCTTSLQWMIRDGELHCFDTMRSSDIWLGWPYDIFNMSMISLGIAVMLWELHSIPVELGNLHLTAASQHLYEPMFDKAKSVIDKGAPHIGCSSIDIGKFKSYQHVIDKLWDIANQPKEECLTSLITL